MKPKPLPYAELLGRKPAALARRAREVPADVPAIEQAKAALTADWPHFVVLEIDQALVELAGDYADTFAFRGYDSVQLAAAYKTAEISQVPVFFACYDIRLKTARLVVSLN